MSGYNLDRLLQISDRGSRIESQKPPAVFSSPPAIGLHQLLVGSEGTLAVITGAEVDLVRVPRVRGLVVPQFDSLAAAMDASGVLPGDAALRR